MTDPMLPPTLVEDRLAELISWAREYLAIHVEGQYTSDAALALALAVWQDERQGTPETRVLDHGHDGLAGPGTDEPAA